ncbi:MAG: glycosyltransferase family 4 protein [Pyrinomonadaceae bacterium]
MTKRVALITHEMSLVGGLPTMVTFLLQTLRDSGRYQADLFSLATSVSDHASLRLSSPATWFRRPVIETVPWHEETFEHVGVWGSELEFQRYRPRRMLREKLEQYDILQFVVGSPPWVCVAEKINRPVLLWTATTTRADRASRLREGPRSRRAWSSLMVPLTERYEARALRIADRIFALSKYTQETIDGAAGSDKVLLAPCGVDTDLFCPGENPTADYILCVARFSDARKNVRLLLNAYAQMRSKLSDVPDLYLIGDPPSAGAQEQLQNLGIADKVKLIGPKRGEELADLYRNAAFFVLSSDEEGLGIVILEAMSSGLAVVSTDCGGPATAISEGQTGLLTPTGYVNAFATAMEKLLRDPALCRRMGLEGRNVARQQFSLAAAGKIFLDTYDEVLNAGLKANLDERSKGSVSGVPAAVHD